MGITSFCTELNRNLWLKSQVKTATISPLLSYNVDMTQTQWEWCDLLSNLCLFLQSVSRFLLFHIPVSHSLKYHWFASQYEGLLLCLVATNFVLLQLSLLYMIVGHHYDDPHHVYIRDWLLPWTSGPAGGLPSCSAQRSLSSQYNCILLDLQDLEMSFESGLGPLGPCRHHKLSHRLLLTLHSPSSFLPRCLLNVLIENQVNVWLFRNFELIPGSVSINIEPSYPVNY